jgi:hypothetical protein
VSVQEREVPVQQHNSVVSHAVFNEGNNIYDDPMFDYPEQCAAEGELSYKNLTCWRDKSD